MREREKLLPHLKWRGTFRPQPSMRRMARLGSTYDISFGVTAGQIHSSWLTLARSQHAGDGILPNTTAMHSFTATSLSALHCPAVSAPANRPEAAISSSSIARKLHRHIALRPAPALTICLIKVLTRPLPRPPPAYIVRGAAIAMQPCVVRRGIDLECAPPTPSRVKRKKKEEKVELPFTL